MSQQLFEQGEERPSPASSGSDSYRVIARRYRPSTFSEVIGQEHVTRTLKNAIEEDRLGHAYLFSGPRGIGKTSTARILARAVNCEKGVSAEPCNECDVCQELEIGSTPDIIEIDAASQRGIDDIRNLRETVRYSPLHSSYRVYIIDESHMLSRDAFNAFLKTLEEPPDHVLFVFATTEPEKMPDTIVSRCQPFQFRRIPHALMLERLTEIVKQEDIDVDESILSDVCRAVDGSLRDAQSVLDQLISISEGRVEAEDLKLVLGTVPSDVLHRVLDGIHRDQSGDVLEQIDQIYRGGGEIDVFLDQFVGHLRDVLVVQACGPDTDLIDAAEHEKKRRASQAEWFSRGEVAKMLEALVNVRSRTDDLYQSRLLLEARLVQLCEEFSTPDSGSSQATSSDPSGSGDQVRESIEYGTDAEDRSSDREDSTSSTESGSQGNTTDEGSRASDRELDTEERDEASEADTEDEETNEESTDRQAEPVNGIEAVRAEWPRVLEQLKERRSTSAELLSAGEPMRLDEDTIVVGFPDQHEYHCNKLSEEEEKERLVEVIEDVFHHNLTVSCILKDDLSDEDTDASSGENDEEEDTPGGSQQNLENHPNVQKVIDSFDADIVNVEE